MSEDSEVRTATLFELNKRLTSLASQANAPQDSDDRRLARRILSGVQAGSRGIPDPEYQELLSRVKPD